MENTLNKCPLCGQNAGPESDNGSHKVHCLNCGYSTSWFKNLDLAEKHWAWRADKIKAGADLTSSERLTKLLTVLGMKLLPKDSGYTLVEYYGDEVDFFDTKKEAMLFLRGCAYMDAEWEERVER